HAGDALVASGLQHAVVELARTRPDVIMVTERAHSHPGAAVVRAGARDNGLTGLDHVSPAAIISAEALRELGGFRAETDTLGGTVAALAEVGLLVAERGPGGGGGYPRE